MARRGHQIACVVIMRSLFRCIVPSFSAVSVVVVALIGGCSTTSENDPSKSQEDASTPRGDASTDRDCSLVGCAAPPPCGQACTEPCGCCPNPECDSDPRDASDDAATGDGGSCDVPLLEWPTDGEACQSWVAANCCEEQIACANDPGCKATVTCINTCEVPEQADCFAPCLEDKSGKLDALASCTKQARDGSPPIPASCHWP